MTGRDALKGRQAGYTMRQAGDGTTRSAAGRQRRDLTQDTPRNERQPLTMQEQRDRSGGCRWARAPASRTAGTVVPGDAQGRGGTGKVAKGVGGAKSGRGPEA